MTRIGGCTLIALVLLVASGSTDAQLSAPGYHVVKTIALGGEGGWDFLTLDAEARRLYIARSDRVMVMDVDTGTVVGEVPHTPGVHGVALVPKRGRGFASNGGDSTVTVFDLKTLREVARVNVGQKPDAILYDPTSGRVFTFNVDGHDATAIDAETDTVIGTIPLGGRPESAVADEQGRVYVNLEDKNEVLALDARALRVVQRWPLAPGREPTGLAMDRARRRLFATCHNEMMVILDADSGRVVATLPLGKGTDAAIFDPDTRFAFSSNADGTLTVVREDATDQFAVAETVATQAGARTVALDPKMHNLFLVTARATAGQRRSYEPGSFVVLVVGK
jgi:YVTN family beta-propeller protein